MPSIFGAESSAVITLFPSPEYKIVRGSPLLYKLLQVQFNGIKIVLAMSFSPSFAPRVWNGVVSHDPQINNTSTTSNINQTSHT